MCTLQGNSTGIRRLCRLGIARATARPGPGFQRGAARQRLHLRPAGAAFARASFDVHVNWVCGAYNPVYENAARGAADFKRGQSNSGSGGVVSGSRHGMALRPPLKNRVVRGVVFGKYISMCCGSPCWSWTSQIELPGGGGGSLAEQGASGQCKCPTPPVCASLSSTVRPRSLRAQTVRGSSRSGSDEVLGCICLAGGDGRDALERVPARVMLGVGCSMHSGRSPRNPISPLPPRRTQWTARSPSPSLTLPRCDGWWGCPRAKTSWTSWPACHPRSGPFGRWHCTRWRRRAWPPCRCSQAPTSWPRTSTSGAFPGARAEAAARGWLPGERLPEGWMPEGWLPGGRPSAPVQCGDDGRLQSACGLPATEPAPAPPDPQGVGHAQPEEGRGLVPRGALPAAALSPCADAGVPALQGMPAWLERPRPPDRRAACQPRVAEPCCSPVQTRSRIRRR